ncbi:unnamed protein product [Euphydryas editha]|uniref:Uncharacterized protein n=1 Tax=Euphydryas editha TaxID=104508 RepID=A0AAU9TWI8_EUPED|nr:unnamed protein product [Euphydryas editha]
MPEETKKSSNKGKSDAKEQRKRRQGRQHPAPIEKKVEKAPEVPKEPEKPAYEPPGPEFYQSLKRETDEILKITEEANSKYKKKEIQSNWAKYEMPIETYEEIDEQENLGADYEALIQASFSVGGHFQFKHEKSWDISSGPTPFDKYFDINMESLNVALSTIPFYERNDLDISLFNESDIQSMDHRATKFKHKYYNEKKYTTPDLEAQENILKSLTSSDNIVVSGETNIEVDESKTIHLKNNDYQNELKDINLKHCEAVEIFCDKTVIDSKRNDAKETLDDKMLLRKSNEDVNEKSKYNENTAADIQETETINVISVTEKNPPDNRDVDSDFDILQNDIIADQGKDKVKPETTLNRVNVVPTEIELPKAPKEYPISIPQEPPKNPIIESPEDLEKWLDDFLDG